MSHIDITGKELAVFDLDGTLAPSKFPMDKEMADLIVRLLARMKVAVISGSGFTMFETNFLNIMPATTDNYTNLVLLPTSGTQLFSWKGSWTRLYAEFLTPPEKTKIKSALHYALKAAGFQTPTKIYGEQLEDRESQFTFSANGQNAPLAVKEAWDPTREKRERIAAALREKIPEFDVRVGGANSVDITRRGVNKAYGIHKLEQYFHIPIDKMIFVGDKLMLGGNDYPARSTGVDCIEVSGPGEAKKLISGWLGK